MKENSIEEITLRKYESPINIEKREIIKKICLSLGLLQEGDSRDVIVDLLLALIISKKENKSFLTSEEIQKYSILLRKNYNLEINGLSESNIRRQLKRLKDLFLIEKIEKGYRINEKDTFLKIFEEKIEKFYISGIISRIKEYLSKADKI